MPAIRMLLTILFLIAASLDANADVTFKIKSSAATESDRIEERSELETALRETFKSTEFLRTLEMIRGRCGERDITLDVRFGDSGTHTGTSDAGGTFVPTWKDADNPDEKRVWTGGVLIIDRARLAELRPNHAPSDFYAEVVGHEFWHAYEDCIDEDFHSEDDARRSGERVAQQLGHPTLDETRTVNSQPEKSENGDGVCPDGKGNGNPEDARYGESFVATAQNVMSENLRSCESEF